MKVTIELTNFSELEKLLAFIKTMDIENLTIKTEPIRQIPVLRGDKTQSGSALFGIWKDNPKQLSDIRTANWKRNWNKENDTL
jgi:hypothetical protein